MKPSSQYAIIHLYPSGCRYVARLYSHDKIAEMSIELTRDEYDELMAGSKDPRDWHYSPEDAEWINGQQWQSHYLPTQYFDLPDQAGQ